MARIVSRICYVKSGTFSINENFLIECRIMDGDRLWAVGHVELEILFKGRAFDALMGKPPQSK